MHRFPKAFIIIVLLLCCVPGYADWAVDDLWYSGVSENDELVSVQVKSPVTKLVTSVKVPSNIYIADDGYKKYYQVRSVGYRAFVDCLVLTSVTFASKNVSEIGEQAFSGCVKLTSISIPPSVKEIKSYTFYECRNLTEVVLSDSLRSIAGNAFKGCSKLKNIIFPNQLSSVGANAFNGCSNLISVKMNGGLKEIGIGSFQNCLRLSSLEISPVLNSIGRSAFEGCEALTAVTFPLNVSYIGDRAFYGCTGLSEAVFQPSKVKVSIRSQLFEGCVNLAQVFMTDNVFRIYERAFYGCAKLSAVTLPASISAIGASAFEGCVALDTVKSYIVNPFALAERVFENISPNCVLLVPYGEKQRYIEAGWTTEVFKGGVVEMDAPEGIRDIVVSRQEEGTWYTVDGIKVDAPQHGKIYIHNRKSVLVK